jgi:hypothetical protein
VYYPLFLGAVCVLTPVYGCCVCVLTPVYVCCECINPCLCVL